MNSKRSFSMLPAREGNKKHNDRHRRSRKKNHKAKIRARENIKNSGKPITEKELASHMASIYHDLDWDEKNPKNLIRSRRNKSANAAFNSVAKFSPEHASQIQYLKQLDGYPTLVLNADYQPLSHLPLSIWSWQDSIKSVFSGKVTVVDVYPNMKVRGVNCEMELPSVIALNVYIPQANRKKPSFTRKNVYLRDGYRCQYCSNTFRKGDLSLDHVVPRCKGGRLVWDNTVTCCLKCNGRKGSLPLAALSSVGMKLLRMPRVPSMYDLNAEAGKMAPRKVHPTWAPYLTPSYISSEVS
eukprot:CAMPEP_0195516114 /NCGR_PEP_ID=MMETSP0794_2-20130614/6938_1 /TAXON_ID=515487 /ORGANISM="Stephanopyxis turris, Strain CCMP 815" /LENGTH=296 /DNA_ID=CAMNT_0040644631 /DNA_START=593 /DNA_END=1483 /DNA_ORIENTATION=-